MKRKKDFCLISSFIISIIFIFLTLKFTSIGVNLIFIYFVYFTLTLSILIHILAVIKNKKSKTNIYGLLTSIDALIAILSLVFAIFGTTQSIKNFAYTIFVFTFIILLFFCGSWIKYEKSEK